MMMTVGPKIGIAASLLEMGTPEGAAIAPGEGDMFLRILAGMGRSPSPDGTVPLTVEGGEQAASAAPGVVEGQENLTIKTFRKLLDGNPGEAEPSVAPGEETLTRHKPDKLTEGAETPIDLALGLPVPALMAVPAPLATVTVDGDLVAAPTIADAPAAGDPAAPAAAALLAAAYAASPAAVRQGNVKVATTDASASEIPLCDAPAAEGQRIVKSPDEASASKDGEAVKLTEALKLAPVRMTLGETKSEPQNPDMASIETAPAEVRAAQAGGPSPTLTTLLSAAPLQAVAAQPAPAEGATTVQPGAVVDQLIEQQLDLAHEGEWLDRLARDIARSSGAEGGLRFRLNPEHLGTLHVQLTQGDDGASLRLTADSEAARAIIADAQPRLVAEARAQGVRIAETHVDLGGGHSAAGEQRRQDEGERPQHPLRTDRGSGSPEGDAVERPVNASERYA